MNEEFTQAELETIRNKATHLLLVDNKWNLSWLKALEQLVIATDYLHAIQARKEAIDKTLQPRQT